MTTFCKCGKWCVHDYRESTDIPYRRRRAKKYDQFSRGCRCSQRIASVRPFMGDFALYIYSSRPVGGEMNSNGTAVAGLEKFSKGAPYGEFKMLP